MNRLVCSTWCLLLVMGSALPENNEMLCKDRGIVGEGSDVHISTAVCLGDGTVSYEWTSVNSEVMIGRRQIEYTCYNSIEEHSAEDGTIADGTIVDAWGGLEETVTGGSSEFTVEHWTPNTTCLLYGCYEELLLHYPFKSRYMMSPVECSSTTIIAPTSSLALSPTPTSSLSETSKATKSLPDVSPSNSPVELNSSPQQILDLSIAETALSIGAIVILAILIVTAGVFFTLKVNRNFKKRRYARPPTIHPDIPVNMTLDIVKVGDTISIISETPTQYANLGSEHLEKSPHLKRTWLESTSSGSTEESYIMDSEQSEIEETKGDTQKPQSAPQTSIPPSEDRTVIPASEDRRTWESRDYIRRNESSNIYVGQTSTSVPSANTEITFIDTDVESELYFPQLHPPSPHTYSQQRTSEAGYLCNDTFV